MHTCIYKKVRFSQADGEHVLQNFLGARWVSSEISCNEPQAYFGNSIDVALEQGLQEFRNLIGTKGGRGGEGPTLKGVLDADGNKYNLKPGFIPEISVPIIKSQKMADGAEIIEGKIGSKNQLGWLVHQLKAKYPGLDIDVDQLRLKAKTQKGYLDSHLHLKPRIGGADYFRGLLKSAFNLLGASSSRIALMPCFDNVREFILNGTGSADMFIRWVPSPKAQGIPSLGKFDHFVCVYSSGGNIDGYVQFFGGIGHIIRLARGYVGDKFQFGYLVNPLRDSDPAEERQPAFNLTLLPQFDNGHIKPGPEAWKVYKEIFEDFLSKYTDRAVDIEVSRIIDETLSENGPDASPQQIIRELSQKMALFSLNSIVRE